MDDVSELSIGTFQLNDEDMEEDAGEDDEVDFPGDTDTEEDGDAE